MLDGFGILTSKSIWTKFRTRTEPPEPIQRAASPFPRLLNTHDFIQSHDGRRATCTEGRCRLRGGIHKHTSKVSVGEGAVRLTLESKILINGRIR